jgi:hypothetical protein
MYTLADIKERSLSKNELIVTYIDAMELLEIFKSKSTKVLGWEGWLKYNDGSIGHSLMHQGTIDLSSMPIDSSIAITKQTIMQSYTEWQEKPEAENANLFFCITTNT